ncbi:carbonic anhydrase 1-like [Anticarsia gemmatalis]|uniref:carbonic anhydrase 1-like n=1 Tax=Anticarsia gemmatalis TaxID=129554 RepID=UPI003F75C8FF
MFDKGIGKVTICCLLFIHIQVSGFEDQPFQDQTSPRTNTLFDDADDIQRQLDNEAKDRMKYGRPKTIWVFHFPTHFQEQSTIETRGWRLLRGSTQTPNYFEDTTPLVSEWSYRDQWKWHKVYPNCGGRSQSPVNLPTDAVIKSRSGRALLFENFDVIPKDMTLMRDGRRVVLIGNWETTERPLIYGGAVHSRRYLFDSIAFHWPSEHTAGGLQYPMETQVFFTSAEYKDLNDALTATNDLQAILAISSLHKFTGNKNKMIRRVLEVAKSSRAYNHSFPPTAISQFNPPFKEYAIYHGSLTFPPCTESVVWMIRARTMAIDRDLAEDAMSFLSPDTIPRHLYYRNIQPLNDRRVLLFK